MSPEHDPIPFVVYVVLGFATLLLAAKKWPKARKVKILFVLFSLLHIPHTLAVLQKERQEQKLPPWPLLSLRGTKQNTIYFSDLFALASSPLQNVHRCACVAAFPRFARAKRGTAPPAPPSFGRGGANPASLREGEHFKKQEGGQRQKKYLVSALQKKVCFVPKRLAFGHSASV